MIPALAILLAGCLLAPHLIGLRHARPTVAATIWMTALTLRALIVLFVAVYLVLYLPSTELFVALTHWCWHTVLPLLTTHLGLEGHSVAGTAAILPAVVLAASVISVSLGVVRAARVVRHMLLHGSLGPGPSDSLIIAGAEVMVAAAGIAHPRVVVSAGALTKLDDEELAAGLDHERGHIERRHRYLFVFAEICRGLARFVPGTRRVKQELTFHLERDADRWALARRHDPFALASAICKAATDRASSGFAIASLAGGSGVSDRLNELIDERPPLGGRLRQALTRGIATLLIAVALALVAVLPATAAAGVSRMGTDPSSLIRHCED